MLQSGQVHSKVCAVILISGMHVFRIGRSAKSFQLQLANLANMIPLQELIDLWLATSMLDKVKVFFDIPLGSFEWIQLFLCPIWINCRPEISIFGSSRCGRSSQSKGLTPSIFGSRMVSVTAQKQSLMKLFNASHWGCEGKDVILVDEPGRYRQGHFVKQQEILTDKGATSVRAYRTHGVLSGKSLWKTLKLEVGRNWVITAHFMKASFFKIRALTVADCLEKQFMRNWNTSN